MGITGLDTLPAVVGIALVMGTFVYLVLKLLIEALKILVADRKDAQASWIQALERNEDTWIETMEKKDQSFQKWQDERTIQSDQRYSTGMARLADALDRNTEKIAQMATIVANLFSEHDRLEREERARELEAVEKSK